MFHCQTIAIKSLVLKLLYSATMGQVVSKLQQKQQTQELPTEGLVMKTVDCDWMKLTNQTAHRTNEYETSALVFRRGQSFKVKVAFQRTFNEAGDEVYLEFAIGANAQLVNDTKVRIKMGQVLDPQKWSMVLADSDETSITVEVSIPPNAIVGKYKTVVEFVSKLENGEIKRSRDKEPDVVIIFNPWCKDDSVYLDDEAQREEYVLNDTGNIYRGSTWRISPKRWNFGQFEENILDAALRIIDSDSRTSSKSGKWLQKRRDPIWIVRAASAQVNDGVLVGNWSGDYEGGASPLTWNGSVKILQQYYNTKREVKFGQCWVFSGVMTTILRALGIPTRSVTNFASAHDTEGSMTIDKYINKEGEEVDLGGDSVWNFHVWNESWMTRPDLPKGYEGWQVIDATPQEISLGLYQTGPAPLTAIKKGEVYLGYETPFVFAEVNSDRVTWVVEKDDGNAEITSVGRRYTQNVGKFISTKKVGEDDREDITDQYKFKEGSPEERAAFKLAYGFGSQPDYQRGFLALQDEETADGVDFEFTTDPVDANLFNGDEFTVKVTMKNKGSEKRTVNVTSTLHSTLYTGVPKAFVKRAKFDEIVMEPNASVTKEIKVAYNEYSSKLVDQNAMRIMSVATVKETGKMFSEDYEFRLENKPDSVKIVTEKEMQVGKKSNVTVEFTNFLPVKLTHVTISLEGPGLSSPVTHKIAGQVPPGEKVESTFVITPKRAGVSRSIIADVDTRQIQDLKSYEFIRVKAAPEPEAAAAPRTTEAEVKPTAAATEEGKDK
uniref:protein-glutamine gamma-glutamyltransferase 4-like isoform X2 n=1 Tax=Styela clava TaxID=7725 RepID=UPI001939A99B|nr:protein-glutamine gamma-glutamyltransferase 4-like isoform X2 [Styela clava]